MDINLEDVLRTMMHQIINFKLIQLMQKHLKFLKFHYDGV